MTQKDFSEDFFILLKSVKAKSWSCENCPNWQKKHIRICKSCYWAFPEDYGHIAMRDIRRLDIMWADKDVEEYDRLKKEAQKVKEELPKYVKNVLRTHFKRKNGN